MTRRRTVLGVLGGVVGLVVLVGGAALSPLLDVEEVEVTGVVPERTAEVRRAAAIDLGDPVLLLRPGTVARRVRRIPWVDDVTVERVLPDTIRITVVARVPVGWARAGARVLVVGETGRVLWKAVDPPAGVPELTGLAELASVGRRVAPRALPAAAGAMGSEFRARTAALALDEGALTGRMVGGAEVRFGAPRGIGLKARVAAAVLSSLGATPVAYVDVSVPSAPVSG